MLARVIDHLDAEVIGRPHFHDRLVLDLERIHPLREIGRVPPDVNAIADPQRCAGVEPDDRDGKVAEVMGHQADAVAGNRR